MVAAALLQTCRAISSAVRPPIGAVDAVVRRGDGALDHGDILALVLAHDAFQGGFRLLARTRHDDLVILPGQQIEDEFGHGGVAGAQHRFGVARAILELQPDEHGALGTLHGLHHRTEVAVRQRQRGHHGAAEFHELAARDAASLQRCGQRLMIQ